jgi:cysteinyl-tRNA synthetase
LPLTEVKTWAYQLQGISEPGAVDALAASAYDMLVLEPTRTDWSSDDRFFDTRSMMSRLKASPGRDGVHRKVVLAYVNIAEAEDWRWYWAWSQDWNCRGAPPTDWPEYILACDPDGWEGNYPVAYWDRNWKDVLIYGSGSAAGPGRDYRSVMDEVILDGFDGIYLDWVEAFEDPVVVTAAEAAGLDPAQEMIALIDELGTYARERRPGFVILQQNGVTLVEGNPELMGGDLVRW